MNHIPVTDQVKERLKGLTDEQAARLLPLLAKGLALSRYGPGPTKSEQYIQDRIKNQR